MNRQAPFLALTMALALTTACSKDPEDVPSTAGASTPPVPVPQWVLDSLGEGVPHVSNPTTAAGIALGRKLFYEKALSNDYTMSCATCHVQENAFTDPRPFSIGTDGSVGTRNAMAIINAAWDHRFFWDGRAGGLESQAHDPVVNPIEMANTWPVVMQRLQAHAEYPSLFAQVFGSSVIDSVAITRAIAQFERSLISFNSRYDRYAWYGETTALNEQEVRGMDLFNGDAHCKDCHGGILLSDHALRNNGLDAVILDGGLGDLTHQPNDLGRFKVPTLRNIAATAPYMHDSRFATLEEVVSFYAHDVQLDSPNLDGHMAPWSSGFVNLSTQDEADLVAFLHTLTDSTFLTWPGFAAP